MNLLARYVSALHPDTHRVLGRRLVPLSIGHLLLLHRIRSPIIQGGGIIDATAIALVVWLCSMPYADAVRASQSRWIRLRLAALTLRAYCHRAEAEEQLTRYLQAGSDRPKWWNAAEGLAEGRSTPFWLTVQVTLMRDLGRSQDQALSTPASLAMWLCSAIWEEEGTIDLVSDEQAEILSKVGPPEYRPKQAPNAAHN